MMGVKRVLAGVGAAALLASGAVIGLAGSAQAAPAIEVTPNANLKGGDVVTVKVTGFSPNAPVAIGVHGTDRDVKGPGDAGPSKEGYSKLATADGSGTATAQITIPDGPLGNLTPPATQCPPCNMGASNIGDASERATVELNYAKGGGDAKSGDADDKKAAVAPDDAVDEDLASTGPRETLIMAIAGFVLLQIGLIFAIRATRSVPRRTVA